MASQAFTVDKPESGASAAVDLPQSEASSLSFRTADIQGMQLSDGGQLVISFTDGGTLTINNFRDLADNEVSLTLGDGSIINSRDLFETLVSGLPPIHIMPPLDATGLAYDIMPGRKYEIDFGDRKPVEVSEQDGALLITFDNDGLLVLRNFEQAVTANSQADIGYDGHFLTLREFADGLRLAAEMNDALENAPQSEVRHEAASMQDARTAGEDKLAALAEALAAVEPAAGDTGGTAAGRGGYGFNSDYETTPITPIDDVGPIGPTALLYGVPAFDEPVFPLEEEFQDEDGPPHPLLTVSDALVYEDGSVALAIAADPDAGPDVYVTVIVSGIPASWGVNPNGGIYDAAAGTVTYVMAPGAVFAGGPTLSPPADSDADLPGLSVSAVNTNGSTGLHSGVVGAIDVTTDAVADTPDLAASGSTVNEGDAAPVAIATAVHDTDGSEEIAAVYIRGVPAGFTLSAGTDNGGGEWQLAPGDLAGLTIIPSDPDFYGSLTLTVESVSVEAHKTDADFDLTNDTASAFDDFTVVWKPVADPPSVLANNGVDDVQVKEDGSVDVPLVASLNPKDSPDAVLTVTVTGFDPAWGAVSVPVGSFNPAGTEWSITLAPGTNLSTVFSFTPDAQADIDLTGLVATATATEPATGTSASADDAFDVIVDAVADDPAITASGGSQPEGTPVAVSIQGFLGADLDGSEHIDHYEVAGVPAGFAFNHGTDLGGGVWSFTPGDLAGLTIAAADPEYDGTLSLSATVFTVDVPGDGEYDNGDNTNSATTPFTVIWTPEIDPPTITVNNGINDVQVKEDGSVDVPVVAALSAGAAASEYLTVTITGFDPLWGAVSAPVGSFNPAGTEWSITLAPGQALNTVFTFAPGAQSDIDLTGLVATATATDPLEGTSASADDAFDVIVDAVADKPSLDASSVAQEEGHPVPITLNGSLGVDLDGSERIDYYEISGVPAGFSFNQGSDLGGGVWRFTPLQIAGLTILSADPSFAGTLNLTATVYVTENPVSDGEYDTTDNTNSASDALCVTWTDDDEPILVQPEAVSVDETNLGPVIVSDTVQADFGDDTPGHFAGTGTFAFSTPLTSGGDAVLVLFDITTGTYTGATATERVFTLVIEDNGDYRFTLEGTLDHPDTANPNDAIVLEFGVSATDSDSDTATGTITVTVLDDGVTAHDDVNSYDGAAGTADGNVITGLNGGPGAADDLSHDAVNRVTMVAFGGTSVAVPGTGSISIDGAFGTLTIAADGTYSYAAFSSGGGTTTTVHSLAPVSGDVAGTAALIVKNGFTLTSSTGGDLTWVTTTDGSGIGIVGEGTDKIYGSEILSVDFPDAADAVTVAIADIGSNNLYTGIEFTVYLNGGGSVDYEFDIGTTTPDHGVIEVTLDAATLGLAAGTQITGFDLYSSEDGALPKTSQLLADVTTFTYGADCDCGTDVFTYTLTDGDGDADTATLTLVCVDPLLIVGENVDDRDGSHTPYRVGTGTGDIPGGLAGDILVGDVGGSRLEAQTQDYNFVLMLDVSTSMGDSSKASSKLSLLIDATEHLLDDLGAYDNGTITVRIVPFSSDAWTAGTFTVTDAAGLAAAIDFINHMPERGWTNYEAALQDAISWLQGSEPIAGAQTISYFISDGEPNYYLDNNGNVVANDKESVSVAQINGTADGTNEIAQLQALSDEVIGVGIEIGSTGLSRLALIDSDGTPLNVDDASDLDAALAASNPLNKLASLGDDVIYGGDGGDFIFGDSLNTDALAAAQGLGTNPGAGWAVFEQLEAGPGWDRADTMAYIRSHAEEMGQESTGSSGEGREGGDDALYGGAGDDTIFGQEGNDLIAGGAGDDVLYGGSGADRFLFEAIADNGTDTVKDFNAGEGDILDLSQLLAGTGATQATIDQFVFATDNGTDTVLSVDVAGAGNPAAGTAFVLLAGVTGLGVDDLANAGSLLAV